MYRDRLHMPYVIHARGANLTQRHTGDLTSAQHTGDLTGAQDNNFQ